MGSPYLWKLPSEESHQHALNALSPHAMSNREEHAPCQARGRKLEAELLAELDIFQEVFTRIQAWISQRHVPFNLGRVPRMGTTKFAWWKKGHFSFREMRRTSSDAFVTRRSGPGTTCSFGLRSANCWR